MAALRVYLFACLRRSGGDYRLLVGLSVARRVLPRGWENHYAPPRKPFSRVCGRWRHTNVVEFMRHQARDVFEWLGHGDARIFRVMAARVLCQPRKLRIVNAQANLLYSTASTIARRFPTALAV